MGLGLIAATVAIIAFVRYRAQESTRLRADLGLSADLRGAAGTDPVRLAAVDEFETGTWGDLPQCAHDTHPCVCRGSGGQKTPLGARRAPFGGVTAPTDRFGPPARRRPARNRCARHTSSSMLAPESGNGACSDFFGGDPQ